MTEAEIRALLTSVFTKVGNEARARDSGSGIQLDQAMIFVGEIADAVIAELAV